MRLSVSFLVILWLAMISSPRFALAEPPAEQRIGVTSSGLCGLLYTGSPTCPEGFAASVTTGYAATNMRGHHDRLLGNAGIAYTPLAWLSLSLELAGRIDIHPDDARGKNVTGTGDPWLRGRVGFPVRPGLSLGGELGIWLPGNQAPSFKPSATTVEARGLASYELGSPRFQLLGSLGLRLDNSGNSAPELARLRQGDRIALGLSDSHAILFGVGLGHQLLTDVSVFAELSAQVLVGADAPSFLKSPLRLAAGARYSLLPGLQLEFTLVTSLSQRPSIAVDAPLVPIEPRFAALLGVRYQFGGPKPVEPPPEDFVDPEARDEPKLASVSGVLTDGDGAPLPDAAITLVDVRGEHQGITDAEGRYRFDGVPPGPAQLTASAAGFAGANIEVEAVSPATNVPTLALQPADDKGILRCLVRSFRSEPLNAQVLVRDTRGRRVASGKTNRDGILEISLVAGDYRVSIDAAGYKSQKTNVKVDVNEVAILNVDMREGK